MSDDNDLIRRWDAITEICKQIGEDSQCAWVRGNNSAIASCSAILRTLPAVQVTVKPGEIERAVWSAMSWAADYDSGSNGAPEYTDCGNSFAETECRRAAARIRSAMTVTPAEAVKVPRIIPFHTAAKFGVCIGGRWDGWIMIQHPDGYWVSHHKPEPVDPSIVALRAIGEGKA